MNKKYNIGNYGLFASIIVTAIGIGIFSYPRIVVSTVENDAVLVTIICGLINIALIMYMEGAIKLNNYQELSLILKDNFGKIISKVILFIFSAYFIILISFGIRTFAAVAKMYLLNKTPIEFIILTIILTGSYHLRKGLENIIGFNEAIFWIMFIPAAFLLIFPMKEAHFSNLLPVFTSSPLSLIKGVAASVYSFAGFEIVYFLLPIMKEKKSIKKVSIYSITFITLFYTAVLVMVLAVFTKQDIKILMYSLITLSRIIDIPGTFIERWYGIALTLYVLFFYTTFINLYYFAADSIARIISFKDLKLFPIILSPIIYIVAILPGNVTIVEKLMDNIILYFFAFTTVIVPSMLYIKILLKGKRRKK